MTGGHLIIPVQWTLSSLALVIMLLSLTLGALLIMGICVWPYLIDAAMSESALADSCRTLVIAGVVSLVASCVTALAMGWCDSDYSAVKSLACTYLISLFLSIGIMVALQVDLLGAAQAGVNGGFLSVMVHGMVAMVLAIVPAFISTAVGFILRVIGVLLYSR